ncbi:hypothetical protein OSTOST_20893, partial [Ostertagia ostertagi]
VSQYEAVHPVRGPSDFKKRLGHGRRPRETKFQFFVIKTTMSIQYKRCESMRQSILRMHPVRASDAKSLTNTSQLMFPSAANERQYVEECFYFSHEAMPREPLVVVHVALLNEIADSVQSIVDCEHLDYKEQDCTTAIYYSITATQP